MNSAIEELVLLTMYQFVLTHDNEELLFDLDGDGIADASLSAAGLCEAQDLIERYGFDPKSLTSTKECIAQLKTVIVGDTATTEVH